MSREFDLDVQFKDLVRRFLRSADPKELKRLEHDMAHNQADRSRLMRPVFPSLERYRR